MLKMEGGAPGPSGGLTAAALVRRQAGAVTLTGLGITVGVVWHLCVD